MEMWTAPMTQRKDVTEQYEHMVGGDYERAIVN